MSERETQDGISKSGARGPSAGSLVLMAIVGAVVIGIGFMAFTSGNRHRLRMKAGDNLMEVGKALRMYADEFDGEYPTADKWCDLLIEHTDLDRKLLRHPLYGAGPCDYAMNPNAEPNSPGDMIVLFETAGGWNQHGGREILKVDKDNECDPGQSDGHHHVLTLHHDGHVEAGLFYVAGEEYQIWEADPNE